MYNPVQYNGSEDLQNLAVWVHGELAAIAQSFFDLDMIRLVELNVAPTKPRSGMTVLADGTNWNPGSGQGVYTYYAAAWHKLG